MELLNTTEYEGTLHEVEAALHDKAKLADALGRERFIAFIATHGWHDLYFFVKTILGYNLLVDHLHRELCDFSNRFDVRRQGILIPRGHYKSTCVTIGRSIHKGIRKPDLRLAIFHEKATQAEGFLAVIEYQFVRNKLLRALYPDRMPPENIPKTWKWSKSQANLPRDNKWVEPTYFAIGQGSALQGFHFTDMVWDDLIGEEAAGNPEVMEKVIDWMTKAESLSVTPHTLDLTIIGTRWSFSDIYSWAQENMTMDWFQRSAVINDEVTGSPVPLFPEQFTMEILDELSKRDFYIYSCQYLNDPSNPDLQDFDPSWLRYYRKIDRVEAGSTRAYALQEEQRSEEQVDGELLESMVVLIHCDPGKGATQGRAKRTSRHSRSAITVVGLAWPRRVFILEVWAKRCAVDEYLDKICDYIEGYERQLRWVTHEAHSWTNMVRVNLIKRAQERSLPLSEGRCKPYVGSSNVAKETRIRGLQPWFRNGHVFIEAGRHDFEKEFRTFPLHSTFDILDALAQGPEYWDPFPETPERYVEEDIYETEPVLITEPITGLYGA